MQTSSNKETKAMTKRPKPIYKKLGESKIFGSDKAGGDRRQFACPQNYGSSAFYGDSVCCNICPDDDDYFYPFRDFSTYGQRTHTPQLQSCL